jgi:tetratricopeptide (TPR) repeat protein
LSNAYFYKSWLSKAIETWCQAVEHNPNCHPAIANLGVLYQFQEELDEALRWLKKAPVLIPTFSFNCSYIGENYRQLNEPLKIEQWLNRAIEL